MNKIRGVRTSIIITIIELAIFLILACIQAAIGQADWQQISLFNYIKIFSQNLSGFLMLVITTWYVVFTYLILKSTVEVNKQIANPFISISWENQPDEPLDKFTNYNRFISLFTSDESYTVEGIHHNWIVIKITSVREKALSQIDIELEVTNGESPIIIEPFILSWKKSGMHLSSGNSISIGIFDISLVPNIVTGNINIKRLSYKSEDSSELQTEYEGTIESKFSGNAQYLPKAMTTESEGRSK